MKQFNLTEVKDPKNYEQIKSALIKGVLDSNPYTMGSYETHEFPNACIDDAITDGGLFTDDAYEYIQGELFNGELFQEVWNTVYCGELVEENARLTKKLNALIDAINFNCSVSYDLDSYDPNEKETITDLVELLQLANS